MKKNLKKVSTSAAAKHRPWLRTKTDAHKKAETDRKKQNIKGLMLILQRVSPITVGQFTQYSNNTV